ncbi:TetR/AcrR family transcriptional regulator [Cryptosporangium japonicum]|uniref:TetR/AcrR family transcriptional regulator n=1 Tax=Cryptosporangium japonicum TaxID=80872 RepID=A0ABN0VAC0_9ACTN
MATPVSSDPVAASGARTGRLPRSARRRQLLTAAQEVFVANGYHAAAMDDIADRAGVSKPVLYQHFPGKLDLYLALIDQHTEALVNHVTQALAGTTDNKIRVHLATKAYFDFVDGEGEAFRLVFESDLRNEPAVRERVERASQLCMEAIADTIGHDTGVSRSRAELLAVGLTGASEIAARYWLNANRSVPKEEAVGLLSTLLWRGISDFPLEREAENSAQR